MTDAVDSLDRLELVHAAIVIAGTDAQDRVYRPGDWPTQPGQYPIIKLRLVNEDRTSLGRGGPQGFLTIATVRMQLEVSEPAMIADGGAAKAEASLWALKRQVDVAVVNDYELERSIQHIPFMRSQLAYSSEAATHLAGIQTDLGLEFYEGPENFARPQTVDLDEVDASLTNNEPTGFSLRNLKQ